MILYDEYVDDIWGVIRIRTYKQSEKVMFIPRAV